MNEFFVNFEPETYIPSPSAMGGSCPTGTYKHPYSGVDSCCCSNGCCWDKCTENNPPDTCIEKVPGASWRYNSQLQHYQACVGCGKFTIFSFIVIFVAIKC